MFPICIHMGACTISVAVVAKQLQILKLTELAYPVELPDNILHERI